MEITTTRQIRDAGHDEYWLQQFIVDNPASLGLGDLEAIAKERQQASGGRLDVLLKDPEDDTMYEVEIMLGETDETHIIRTIEYWQNEQRRWPHRSHYAVIVAEHINRRFFNVIHLLSHSIPIIAIQVAIIELGGKQGICFTTLLDTYEEVDDGTSLDTRQYKLEDWQQSAKWTVDAAEKLQSVMGPVLGETELDFLKYWIAIDGSNHRYMDLHRRSNGKSLLQLHIGPQLHDEATSLLDASGLTYIKKPRRIVVTVDKEIIQTNASVFVSLAKLLVRKVEP